MSYDHENIRGAVDPKKLHGPRRFPHLHWFGGHNGPTIIESGYENKKDLDIRVEKESHRGDSGWTSPHKDHGLPKVTIRYAFDMKRGKSCSIQGPDGDSIMFRHDDLDTVINRAKWAAARCFDTLENALKGYDEPSCTFARETLAKMQSEGWTLSGARSDIFGAIRLSFHRASSLDSKHRDALGNPIEVEFVTLFKD